MNCRFVIWNQRTLEQGGTGVKGPTGVTPHNCPWEAA